jgi:hypothetical protein
MSTQNPWIKRSTLPLWVGFIAAVISIGIFIGDFVSGGKLLEKFTSKRLIFFEKKEAITSQNKGPDQITIDKKSSDKIITSVLKSIWVSIALIISLILSIPAFLFDIVTLPFGGDSNALTALWNYTWNHITCNWFFSYANLTGRIIGIITMIICIPIIPLLFVGFRILIKEEIQRYNYYKRFQSKKS